MMVVVSTTGERVSTRLCCCILQCVQRLEFFSWFLCVRRLYARDWISKKDLVCETLSQERISFFFFFWACLANSRRLFQTMALLTNAINKCFKTMATMAMWDSVIPSQSPRSPFPNILRRIGLNVCFLFHCLCVNFEDRTQLSHGLAQQNGYVIYRKIFGIENLLNWKKWEKKDLLAYSACFPSIDSLCSHWSTFPQQHFTWLSTASACQARRCGFRIGQKWGHW